MQEGELKFKIIKGTEEKEEEVKISSEKKFSIKQFFINLTRPKVKSYDKKPSIQKEEDIRIETTQPFNIQEEKSEKTLIYERPQDVQVEKPQDILKQETKIPQDVFKKEPLPSIEKEVVFPTEKKNIQKTKIKLPILPIKKFIVGIIIIIILGISSYKGYQFIMIKRESKIVKKVQESTTTVIVEPIIKPQIATTNETTSSLEATSTLSSTSTTSTLLLSTTSTQISIKTPIETTTSKELATAPIITTTPSISTTSTNNTTITSTPQKINTTSISQTRTIPQQEKNLEPSSPKSEEIKVFKKEEIPIQKSSEPKELGVFPQIQFNVKEIDNNGIKNTWISALKIQKEAGSLYEIKFLYNGENISNDIIVDYFINPSFIEEKYVKDFKQNLIDYKILFYYTYTRKYPVLIFKIKNESFVITFLRLWDKETLLKDMYNLYLGLPKGKLVRNFTITESFEGIKYNIAYYDNDYKFIWTLHNDYLIFSTSLNAFKYIIKRLK